MLRFFILVIPALFLWMPILNAQITITYRDRESRADKRYDYDTAVLRLALEKTVPSHGQFNLVPSPVMNYSRTAAVLKYNSLPNFLAKHSFEPRLVKELGLDYVRFPVDLGIVGYRVFFVNTDTREALAQVNTLEELKAFTIGQGSGWSDIKILRDSGFTVIEVPSYDCLFKMVAVGRFNLLSRGTNELLEEYLANRHIPGFTYDRALCLYYPLPRFFFTHARNRAAIERVTQGLIKAYKDGSLLELWHRHYKKSIEFVRLRNRKFFSIPNRNLDHLDFDYRPYLYRPGRENPPGKNNEKTTKEN